MVLAVRVPTSKSYAQRALVLAALAPGRSVVEELPGSDDVALLLAALRAMGAPVDQAGDRVTVEGGRPLEPPPEGVHLGNAGTAVRFVTGLSLLAEGPLLVDGVEAMRRRPMAGLLAALRSLGVEVEELGARACPPVRLERRGRPAGRVLLDATGSSQQVSALLLAGTRLEGGLEVELSSEPPSRPYIDLTLDAIRAFGGEASWTSPRSLRVEARLAPARYVVEGDWSSAAMVLAAGWIRGVEVRVDNLSPSSLQGDRVFVDVLEALARPGPRAIDLGDAPDLVPPAVAAALFAEGATRLERIAHLRIKESDRIAVLAAELGKVGARIEAEADSMTVRPGPLRGGASLDPHGDHRMAMAFGLVGLRVPGLEVRDQGCVTKSFPGFFDVLERFR